MALKQNVISEAAPRESIRSLRSRGPRPAARRRRGDPRAARCALLGGNGSHKQREEAPIVSGGGWRVRVTFLGVSGGFGAACAGNPAVRCLGMFCRRSELLQRRPILTMDPTDPLGRRHHRIKPPGSPRVAEPSSGWFEEPARLFVSLLGTGSLCQPFGNAAM